MAAVFDPGIELLLNMSASGEWLAATNSSSAAGTWSSREGEEPRLISFHWDGTAAVELIEPLE